MRNTEEPLIPSPCCGAHSTQMTRVSSVRSIDGNRRCARCQNLFSCRIDIQGEDHEEVLRIRAVGERLQQGQPWANNLKGTND